MPAFYFDSDEFIQGSVMANYTSGAPVKGNLTLKATFKQIRLRPGIKEAVVERNLTFVSIHKRIAKFIIVETESSLTGSKRIVFGLLSLLS